MPMAGVLEVYIPTTEIRSPRSRMLAPIPWSGLQLVSGLTYRVDSFLGGRSPCTKIPIAAHTGRMSTFTDRREI